ncbi:hypothetical protein LXL04_005744 [Taraxacum kok-saghyz]
MVLTIWELRKGLKHPDLDKAYEATDNYFKLKLHYGGVFTKVPGRKYKNGNVAYFDFVDIDLFSVHDINEMVRDIGYLTETPLFYQYCKPNICLDYGLMLLGNDQDVLTMTAYIPTHREISVYIETGETTTFIYDKSHSKPQSQVINDGVWDPNGKDLVPVVSTQVSQVSQVISPQVEALVEVVVQGVGKEPEKGAEPEKGDEVNVVENDMFAELEDMVGHDYSMIGHIDAQELLIEPTEDEITQFHDNSEGESDESSAFVLDEGWGKDEGDSEEQGEEEGEGEGVGDCEGEGEGEDSCDTDYFEQDSNLHFDVDVDMSEFMSAVDVDEHGILSGAKNVESFDNLDDELRPVDLDGGQFAGFAQDERKMMLMELNRPSTCSEGVIHTKPFIAGQLFKTKEDVKSLVRLHAVNSRRALHLTKNDKIRVRITCKGVVGESGDGSGGPATRSKVKGKGKGVINNQSKCPWAVQISRSNENEDWMGFCSPRDSEHTGTNHEIGGETKPESRFEDPGRFGCTPADNILQQIQSNPSIPIKALHEELTVKMQLGLSKQKVARAKRMAAKVINGYYQVLYRLLHDYCLELRNTNPGTTVRIDLQPQGNPASTTRVFRRIYVCLGALKLGFQAGMRDFLGLDDTFMKGPFLGQILTAVGLDSNNGIYPLAYAVVEAETFKSWTWFLELLGEDLNLGPRSNFTFISDRQKGLLPALSKNFLNAEHRYCLRHIQENLKKNSRDKNVSDQVWKCGRATTVNHFQRAMDELKEMHERVHQAVSVIPASSWSKSHFSGRAHTDCLLNNLCEVFNAKIEDAKDQPIITCLEYIREYLMKRLCVVQAAINKCETLLTPTATQLFEVIKKEAARYVAQYNGAVKYQVGCPWQDQYVVDLNDRSCTCRNWEITGMPCKHAVAAIWDRIANSEDSSPVEEYVHPCYMTTTWRAMYFNKIDPINGRSLWPKSESPYTLLPPKHHKQIGRPKKKRKRGVDEDRGQTSNLSRRYVPVTCAKCGNKGHNSRTCKGQGELVIPEQEEHRGVWCLFLCVKDSQEKLGLSNSRPTAAMLSERKSRSNLIPLLHSYKIPPPSSSVPKRNCSCFLSPASSFTELVHSLAQNHTQAAAFFSDDSRLRRQASRLRLPYLRQSRTPQQQSSSPRLVRQATASSSPAPASSKVCATTSSSPAPASSPFLISLCTETRVFVLISFYPSNSISFHSQFCTDLKSQLKDEFMKALQTEGIDGNEGEGIKPLPWYPDNFAWMSSFSRMQLRKNKNLESKKMKLETLQPNTGIFPKKYMLESAIIFVVASSTNKEDTKFKRFWIQSNPRKCSSGEDVQVVDNGDVEMSKFKDGNHMLF